MKPMTTELVYQVHVQVKVKIRDEEERLFTVEEARALSRSLTDSLLAVGHCGGLGPIIDKVAIEFGIEPAELVTGGRPERVVRPRQVAMYLARRLTGLSYHSIGGALGGKDHGTTIHAEKTIENFMDAYPAWRNQIERLSSELSTELDNTKVVPLSVLPAKLPEHMRRSA